MGRGSGWRCRRRWACRPAPQSSGAARNRTLVRLRPPRLRDAGLPAPQTRLGRLSRAEFGIGEHPHGCPRLLLDLGLTLGRATEAAVRESTRALHELEELLLGDAADGMRFASIDRKSTRLNSSHGYISYAVFCLKKKLFYLPRERERTAPQISAT